ncbi:hypothetical protein BDR05DRAFT_998483 [Suillus weaverae]|nr:hypothetical protein BDR05DRAFT_998483 [Suillus weaverae]
MYAAEFTTNADQHYCEYANCFSGHPGTVPAITYIEHKDPRKLGKWLCEKCSRYQRSKFTTTKKISDAVIPNISKHGFGIQSEYDGAAIHKQTAEAQCGKSQLAVRAVGLACALANYQFVPLPNWPAAPGPSDIHHANPLGPNISIYDAHKIYEEMRDRLARQAYASSVPEVDIVELISNIPYCIGANDLKASVYLTVLPMFIKWSMGLTFTFEEAHLRLVSSFEEILPCPSGEDINAIASHFLKTRNTKQQFNAGKGIKLHLNIPHAKFLAAEQRRNGEEVAESKSHDDTPHVTAATVSPSKNVQNGMQCSPHPVKCKLSSPPVPSMPSQKPRTLDATVSHAQPPVPSTPPQKPQTLDAAVSPDVSTLCHALQAQAIPVSQPNLPFLTLRTFKALLQIIPPISLSALITDPSASDVPNTTAPPNAGYSFFQSPKQTQVWSIQSSAIQLSRQSYPWTVWIYFNSHLLKAVLLPV